MEGATLLLWESRTQDEIKKNGKISITWYDFIASIKRQFYPLSHMKKVHYELAKFQKFER